MTLALSLSLINAFILVHGFLQTGIFRRFFIIFIYIANLIVGQLNRDSAGEGDAQRPVLSVYRRGRAQRSGVRPKPLVSRIFIKSTHGK